MPKKLSKLGILKYFPEVIQDEIWSFCGDQFPIEKYSTNSVVDFLLELIGRDVVVPYEYVLYAHTVHRIYNLLYLYHAIKDEYQVFFFDFVWYITALISHRTAYGIMYPNYKKMNGLILYIAKDIVSDVEEYIRHCLYARIFAVKNIHLDINKYNKKYYLKYFNKEINFEKQFRLFKRDLDPDVQDLTYEDLLNRVEYISDNNIAAQDRYKRFAKVYEKYNM